MIGLGTVGITAAGICSGLTGLLLLNARRRNSQSNEESLIQIITATPAPPSPTPDPRFPMMIPRSAWGALRPDHNATNENGFFDLETNREGWLIYPPPLSDAYRTVVVHHSVVDENDDVTTLLEIQNAHRNDRGWADVAYHYFVGKSGIVYEGRQINARGSHVAGFNTGSIGVCFLGDYTRISPTQPQVQAAQGLITWLAQTFALTHLAGHRDFNGTTLCPGGNIGAYLPVFAENAGLTFGTDGYVDPYGDSESSETACACGRSHTM